jgi:hypothetical protein
MLSEILPLGKTRIFFIKQGRVEFLCSFCHRDIDVSLCCNLHVRLCMDSHSITLRIYLGFFLGGEGGSMHNIRPNICITQNAIGSYKNSFLENLNVCFSEICLNEERLS